MTHATSLERHSASQFLESLREPEGRAVSPGLFVELIGTTREGLALMAGVDRSTLTRSPHSERLQRYLRDAAGVLAVAVEVSGDVDRAVYWYRTVPLIELGGKTAEQLVAAGHAEGVKDYIISLSSGSVG